MTTTPIPNSLFQNTMPLSSRYPFSVLNCSSPLNINGIADTKTSNSIENGGLLKTAVDQQVDELVKATQRVELAKKELAEAQNQEFEARKMMQYLNRLETKPAEVGKEQSEGKHGGMVITEEKLESVKAATISAIVGTLASLPISLTHVATTYELTVSTAITITTCALYGATFRYAIRRDLDNFHLKTGTSAAFGIVKGLATVDGRLSLEQDPLNGALCVSENVLIFLLAAAGLDICYKMGILTPFPVKTSVSRTKM